MRSNRSGRIEALDIFRALTMFLMLFVNDIPGLKNIPHWLLHATANEDMLGFSDTIFPGFLFAMGMAIPFAIENRLKKGDTYPQVGAHILARTIALLVMGVFTVNRDTIDPLATGMSMPYFSLLMVLGFFLVWSVYPSVKGWKKYLILVMKMIGIAILVYLFYIYKGRNGMLFSPQWWGILGLIGWTYLVCAVIYLFTQKNLFLNTLMLIVLIGCSILSETGTFDQWKFTSYIPSEATLHTFGMAGIWASLLMQRFADRYNPRRFYLIMSCIGIVMLAAAIYAHQYWIISKIQATPTWLFYCCALFFPLFAFVYHLTDVKGRSHWFNLIKPAGTVTLTCYIIPYAWYSVQELLDIQYPDWLQSGIPGLAKSFVFSLLIIGIAWILMKMRIRLKI
ncbi:DUF5009 domain-containing protein [Parabacteroides sp. PF5-9]|uniref:DUF5009 domain-containing protein n=1 Tax=Parabacteroides sp. PF5-9 TaxID=1742404 RepID=UPI002472F983|nr:DUF5009 domain-containing protein [Parabacteroides sp. PF5-9]